MEVRQVMSITEETQEPTVEALTVQVLQTILIMLVLVETVQPKVWVLQTPTVAITTLVLQEQVVLQITSGQVEVETLRQEVHLRQIAGREVHRLQAHRVGVAVLQAAVEHQEAHHQAVEVVAVEVAVDQDN
jgi:hypothetical protein